MASPVTSLRLSEDDLRKLDELLEMSRFSSRSALISSWIRVEYDRVQGSPELKALLQQMLSLRDQIRSVYSVED